MPETASLSENPKKRSAKPDLRSKAPTVGDNGPDRDDILFFAGQFRQADEKVKEARTNRKRIRQQAKLRGIEVEVLDHVMAVADEEDGTTINKMRTFKRYAEFMGLPAGAQLDFFDSAADGKAKSRESVLQKAHREGYERGIQGINPDEQAYPPMTDEGQEHLKGWHEGQDVLKAKFLKLNEEAAAAEAAKAAKKKGKAKDAEANGEAEPAPAEAAGETKH